MPWTFPDGIFDLVVDGDTEYINCRVIANDQDVLTIERDSVLGFGRTIRVRTQVRVDDVKAIHEHAVTARPEEAGVTAGAESEA